ncbi:MAG: cation:proton antiporter [Blastocatellia bacterium]|nr:cation:proton antiporter [Blastocatellia bacterium]MDW8257032.1 cation:proton antiporter [Acidobacteriota bacterium]
MPEHSFLRDLGLLLLFGFLGAWLAARRGQSVIIGYILVGAVLGPNALGVIAETALVRTISELGILLLMFFLGVEFSLERLKRVRGAVLFVGTGELLANLSVGFLVGYALGWSMIERAFLAGIVAMSSSGVVAKLLIEWRRTANPEAEALMGIMIFEDFVAVLYLGVLAGLSGDSVHTSPLIFSLLRATAFYALVLGIGGKVLSRALTLALRLRSEELFALLWLALIILAGVGAAQFGLAPAAGAFLLGMISPTRESDLGERIYGRLESFRDVFLALFFLTFGMLLEPESLRRVLPLVLLVAPLSILTELVVTSSLSFLAGFPAPIALAIGAGMIPRGEYALLYAAFGQQLGLIREDLFQFTGWYVFLMTLVAPAFMRNTRPLYRALRRLIPAPIAFAGTLISTTLQPMTIRTSLDASSTSRRPPTNGPRSLPISESALTLAGMIALLIVCAAAFATRAIQGRAILFGIGVLLLVGLARTLRRTLEQAGAQMDLTRFSTPRADPRRAIAYTAHVVLSLLGVTLLAAALWSDLGAWALLGFPLLVPIHIGRAWKLHRAWRGPAPSGNP